MPTLTVEGAGQYEVPQGKRLVLALTEEAGIDQLHACGGNARCTTCRVEFVAGEPEKMTVAEQRCARRPRALRRPTQLPDPVRSRYDGPYYQPAGRKRTQRRGTPTRAEIAPPPVWVDK